MDIFFNKWYNGYKMSKGYNGYIYIYILIKDIMDILQI
jgi:hypothetical protein